MPTAGLFVAHIAPGSPAQQAGVHVGDTIVGLDGTAIQSTKEFLDLLTGKVGRRVQLEMRRSEQRVTADCQVEAVRQ